MEISIIIVNWNSIDFARDCIASIQSTLTGYEYEVIIVDNASKDDCRSLVNEFPSLVKLVDSHENIGFAGANNLGFQHSTGNKVLFLNPDTVVMDGAIQKMAAQLDAAPRNGAVGCRQLNRDLSIQTSSVQPFPTIWNQLFGLDFVQRRWSRWSVLGIGALVSNDSVASEVEVVSGACIMVKRDVFARVGGFSTEYFMYAEEADLCYRIRHSGYCVIHVHQARIVHFGGEASKNQRSTFSDVVMRESIFKLLRKFRGTVYAMAYRLVLLASAVGRLTVLIPFLAMPATWVDHLALLQAIRKWRSIASWSLGMEGWSRDLTPKPVAVGLSRSISGIAENGR